MMIARPTQEASPQTVIRARTVLISPILDPPNLPLLQREISPIQTDLSPNQARRDRFSRDIMTSSV